jgi:hypothetical protein
MAESSGYNMRAKVEASIGRYKQVIGDGLRFRRDNRRMTGVAVAVTVMNRMLKLGRARYTRIAYSPRRFPSLQYTVFVLLGCSSRRHSARRA